MPPEQAGSGVGGPHHSGKQPAGLPSLTDARQTAGSTPRYGSKSPEKPVANQHPKPHPSSLSLAGQRGTPEFAVPTGTQEPLDGSA